MENMEAKILLKNLLKRIKQVDEDSFELKGSLTDDEVTALNLALNCLDISSVSPSTSVSPIPVQPTASGAEITGTREAKVTNKGERPVNYVLLRSTSQGNRLLRSQFGWDSCSKQCSM